MNTAPPTQTNTAELADYERALETVVFGCGSPGVAGIVETKRLLDTAAQDNCSPLCRGRLDRPDVLVGLATLVARLAEEFRGTHSVLLRYGLHSLGRALLQAIAAAKASVSKKWSQSSDCLTKQYPFGCQRDFRWLERKYSVEAMDLLRSPWKSVQILHHYLNNFQPS